jgi:hypothetical protein
MGQRITVKRRRFSIDDKCIDYVDRCFASVTLQEKSLPGVGPLLTRCGNDHELHNFTKLAAHQGRKRDAELRRIE